jgi:hypothetical protein
MGIGKIDMTAKWGWYNALYVLADEKFLGIDQVTERPFKESLTMLAYLKDKRHE